MEYWFYHLERASEIEALVPLLEKCRQHDYDCLIRATNQKTLEVLDKALWTYRENLWLPHAIEDDKIEPSEQPILLTLKEENNNFAQAVFIIEGAPLGDIEGIERAFYLIDGKNQDLVAKARIEYKRARDSGLSVSYWQQDETGRWNKKA